MPEPSNGLKLRAPDPPNVRSPELGASRHIELLPVEGGEDPCLRARRHLEVTERFLRDPRQLRLGRGHEAYLGQSLGTPREVRIGGK